MKNELMKNVIKMVVVMFVVMTTGCAYFDKGHIWLYDTINGTETNTVPPVVSQPTGQPDKPAEPLPTGDVIDGGKLPITVKLSNCTAKGDKFSFDYEPIDNWPKKLVKVDVQAIIYVSKGKEFYKFDWLKPRQKSKGMENIHGGYIHGFTLSKGEECYLMITDVDKKQRSNTCKVEWK